MFRTLILALALALPAAAAAQDPADRDTVIEFGAPEAVAIDTAEGRVVFMAEIAATDAQRTRGLMFREELAPDAGMLFDFEVLQPVSMWMRNTLIPLDLLYIRETGEIAKIIGNAQPLSLRPLPSDFPVIAVLEIAGGRALEAGIRPGDIVRHAMFDNLTPEPVAPVGDESGDAGTEDETGAEPDLETEGETEAEPEAETGDGAGEE